MRIALIAPIHEPCPPPCYGGIERVVALLADGLSQRGHDVTLFASGDSHTLADLRFTEAQALRGRCENEGEALAAELVHVAAAFGSADEFDLIHNHVGYPGIAMAGLVQTPTLSTLHGPFTDDNGAFFEAMADHAFAAISRAQLQGAPRGFNVLGVVHNGIDTTEYGEPAGPGGLIPADQWKQRLVFLGRVSPEKGTHLAIEVARRCGLPLTIAGKVDQVDREYWQTAIQPYVDQRVVEYIGEVGGAKKRELLTGALALLHPVQWPEPFGLVMAEAMACGTPVVAIGMGSVPEVVDDGVTGYVCSDVAGMVAAIGRIEALDPRIIREICRVRFDSARMVESYLSIYHRMTAAREGLAQRL
ncbi:MAG: glycosyltransferase family 4 protein [Cyanobacteria bacterium REEB65]|nr:glycosyltransferase family 4 protein [Cyanobacteria bacterium REEB65]